MCWLTAYLGWTDPCEAPYDPAHIGFTKQELKRHGIEGDDLWDGRIIRPVCRKHHQVLDGPNFHLPLSRMPESVLEYAAEHDLRHLLERRELRRRETDRRLLSSD